MALSAIAFFIAHLLHLLFGIIIKTSFATPVFLCCKRAVGEMLVLISFRCICVVSVTCFNIDFRQQCIFILNIRVNNIVKK
jgi:hypothetical protein